MSRSPTSTFSQYFGEKPNPDVDIESRGYPYASKTSPSSVTRHAPTTSSSSPTSPPNATPLGLLSFATGVMLTSIYNLHPLSISTPSPGYSLLIFFSGICQYIAGTTTLLARQTLFATIFYSYASFNLSLVLMDVFIPAVSSSAMSDAEAKAERDMALAIWLWVWVILTLVFLVGAMRTTWVTVTTLGVLSVDLSCQALGLMLGKQGLVTAGNSLGVVVAFLAYYAGAAALWGEGNTPIKLPLFEIRRGQQLPNQKLP